MDVAAWLSPLVALVGVWIGGALSKNIQDRSLRQMESQRWVDMRQHTYGSFLSAVRALRGHITDPKAQIQVTSHPDGLRFIPSYDQTGLDIVRAVERVFAEVQLAAEHDQTITEAARVYRITYRLAAARVLYGLPLPHHVTAVFYGSMRSFLNAARDELRLKSTAIDGFGPDATLQDLDRDLRDKYELNTKDILPGDSQRGT